MFTIYTIYYILVFIVIDCGEPPSLVNASIDYSSVVSTTLGSVVKYSCEDHHGGGGNGGDDELPVVLTCDLDGHWSAVQGLRRDCAGKSSCLVGL